MEAGRRRLLSRMWVALGAVAGLQGGWIGLSFLRPRRRAVTTSALFVAGPVARFAPGTVTALPERQLYIARLGDGGFLALHRECTHLGCTVPWDASRQHFACPCHGSAFDITGAVIAAPAPRPLDFYPVRVENGLVKVDLDRRQRRDAFDVSQVAV